MSEKREQFKTFKKRGAIQDILKKGEQFNTYKKKGGTIQNIHLYRKGAIQYLISIRLGN